MAFWEKKEKAPGNTTVAAFVCSFEQRGPGEQLS